MKFKDLPVGDRFLHEGKRYTLLEDGRSICDDGMVVATPDGEARMRQVQLYEVTFKWTRVVLIFDFCPEPEDVVRALTEDYPGVDSARAASRSGYEIGLISMRRRLP